MKKFIFTIIISLFTTTLIFGQKENKNEKDQYQIQVDGLGCPFCAYGLEKKFKEFKYIKNIVIDITTGNFQFTYPSETPLTIEAVTEKVKEAGYTPKQTTITRNSGIVEESKPIINGTQNNKNLKYSLIVQGNCEMCQSRIETAALSLEGVTYALWNKNTKQLEYQTSNKVTSKEIAQKIANKIADVGHDNALAKSAEATYRNLPPCCTYRKN